MSIEEQVLWEEECQRRGTERYYANQERLRENGQGDTTDVMSYLIKDRLLEAGIFLKELVSPGQTGKSAQYNSVIRLVAGEDEDYTKLAYLGLKSVLKAVQVKEKNTVLKVILDIAARIEADLKCQMFEASYPEYYDTVRKSFAQQNVTDYVHKHKVMMKKFGDFEIDWVDWAPSEKTQIGTRILRAILNVFGDVIYMRNEFTRGKHQYKLDTTDEFDKWASEFEKERGLLFPIYLPMKVAPRPWVSLKEGGYHTPALRLKFIKTKSTEHRKFINKNIPQHHFDAVNKMQRTPWKINRRVLDVQAAVYHNGLGIGMPSNVQIKPPAFPKHLEDIEKDDLTSSQKEEIKAWKILAKSAYGREQQRKGQILAFMQSHKLAKELQEWEKFYFAYTCDFRGRIYCATSGLSPQGADTAKGLLQFGKAIRLGDSGVKWLAVHGANTFGEDKISYEDRVTWIKSKEQQIRAVVEDPLSNRDFWGNADKPYQFLAFCYEWADCNYGRNKDALSSIPVGLDGSCNGLQHFSAILRDEVGAKATNLENCNKPADIYQEVADVTTSKLKELDDPRARKWLDVGVTRKCAKRPVMTLPYGATQTSARQYIMEYVIENWAKFELAEEHQWEMASYLTPILWESIGEVVIAARAAMDWLQKNVGNTYAKWLTPLNFPVYQYYKNVESIFIRTQLDGSIQLKFKDFDREGDPAKRSQRNGIAPNFVHSIDSTHMVMTINSTDLGYYAMIHDDFGTHAGNTEILFKAIRKSFLELYTTFDPIKDWADQVGADTETLPSNGNYRIESIINADYFFG